FESEFGRLLSQNELMTLNTWLSKYSEADILDGLRNAVIYKKVSMQYINAILANKQKERLGSQ
ncbi:DnaD domain protein, partial [Erysipelothrix rhusiopathiae]|nr:DnaD domain protein [Erysipelothrix rhusiopathiae]